MFVTLLFQPGCIIAWCILKLPAVSSKLQLLYVTNTLRTHSVILSVLDLSFISMMEGNRKAYCIFLVKGSFLGDQGLFDLMFVQTVSR